MWKHISLKWFNSSFVMKHPKCSHHAVDSPQTLHHWCDACYALTMNNQLNTDIVRDVSYHSAYPYWFLTMQQNTEKLIDTTSMISNLRSVSSVTTCWATCCCRGCKNVQTFLAVQFRLVLSRVQLQMVKYVCCVLLLQTSDSVCSLSDFF